MSQEERYLVLSVDRDDDLGTKGGVPTPVVGRQQVVSAATKLAVADPEEADANAIFAAVKKLDELSQKGTLAEVAVVCGDNNGGFDADRKVRREVESVVAKGNYTGIVFVSDGGDDEQVIPLLQSIKPIVSVERVTIKHSESVEQSYIILGRYLRMLVFDQRYSKWSLGVPGVILLLAGILIVANQVLAAELLTLLIIGGAFFVRGFNLDRWFAGILSRGPYGYVRLFSTIASALVILVGISAGYSSMAAYVGNASGEDGLPLASFVAVHPSLILTYGGFLAGSFISGSLLFLSIGLIVYTTGSMLAHLVRGSPRAWRDAVAIMMIVLLYYPVGTFANILTGGQRASDILLVSYILVGLAVIFGLTSVIVPRVRTRTSVAAE